MDRCLILLGVLAALVSCAPDEQAPAAATSPLPDSIDMVPVPVPVEAARAHADLDPINDSGVSGTVEFMRLDDGVRVLVFVQGLDDGLFGFHIHEGSSCEQARAHFNPLGSVHGDPAARADMRHAGDLGNIRSERRRARYDRIDTILAMDGANSIVGRVVAIDAGQDDLNTEPDGAPGDIAACGIIEAR